jgi:hypothetical protein
LHCSPARAEQLAHWLGQLGWAAPGRLLCQGLATPEAERLEAAHQLRSSIDIDRSLIDKQRRFG